MHPAGADVVRVAVLMDGVGLAAIAERTLKDRHVRAAQLLEARCHVQARRAGACGAYGTPEFTPRGKLSFPLLRRSRSAGWRGGSPCARP